MATNQLGIRNSNTIIPLTASTKRTKEIALTVTGTNWTTTRAVGMSYADSAGVWRMRFNIAGSISSGATSLALTLGSPTAVVFKSTTNFRQAVAVSCGSAPYTGVGFATYNTATLELTSHNDAASTTDWRVSGDVELNAEPTWADANMEGVVAVDVFVPPAAAGIQGLVDNRVANTLGTPILGKTDGAAVAAGYVGEFKELGGAGTGGAISSNTVNDSNLGFLTLQKGVWDIQLAVYFGFDTVTGLQAVSCFIGTASGTSTAGRDLLKNYTSNRFGSTGISALDDYKIVSPTYRVNLSADTDYYAKSYAFFGGGTTSATAYMRATRIS